MLPGLGLGTLRAVDHEDGAVHLGGTGDHVLDVVGVTGAVDVGVVPRLRLVLDVSRVDGDAAGALLGGLVDLVEGDGLAPEAQGLNSGDGGGERGLAVVDVADGADVDVRLCGHGGLLCCPLDQSEDGCVGPRRNASLQAHVGREVCRPGMGTHQLWDA